MGKLIAICISEHRGTQKHQVEKATLIENWGIEKDAHGGTWHRQVSLLSLEKIEEFQKKGAQIDFGAFGENLIIEGFDLRTIPVGTKIQIGTTLLELTQIGKECHSHCQIYKTMGDCIMPREGVFAKVITGGTIRPGDQVQLLPLPKDRPFTAAVITLRQRKHRRTRRQKRPADKRPSPVTRLPGHRIPPPPRRKARPGKTPVPPGRPETSQPNPYHRRNRLFPERHHTRSHPCRLRPDGKRHRRSNPPILPYHHRPRHAKPRCIRNPPTNPDNQPPRKPQGRERKPGLYSSPSRPRTWHSKRKRRRMRKQITEIPHIILSRHTSDNKKQRNNEIKNQKQEKTMKKTRKHLIQILAVPLIAAMITGCRAKTENPPGQAPPTQNTPVQNTSGQETSAPQVQESGQSVEIQVFIAASLKTVMTDLAQQYQKDHPHIKITFNADSSGTLLTQIQEGYECDIFFSAAPKQMNQLEEIGRASCRERV